MSHIDPGPLATYESLADPHLTGYFNNSRMRKHLKRMGLITSRGEIVSEKVFRLNNARKEHQRHVRDVLAQAIVHKALDMERHRQMHIKRQLEEIGKIERVRRVRAERALRGDEDILPLLSPTAKQGRKGKKGGKQEKVPILQTVTDSEDYEQRPPQSVGYPALPAGPPYNTRAERMTTQYPNVEVDNQHLYNMDRDALRSFTLNLSQFDLGSGVSPYSVPAPPTEGAAVVKKKSKRRPATATGMPRRPRAQRPRSNARSLRLHRREPPMMHRAQVHTLARVTFKYLGQMVHLDHEEEDPRDEVVVMQQHCGGENLRIFKKMLMKGDTFVVISRRHRTFPFSLTFYLNGVQVERLSTCCEYKHKTGHKLGAKSSHFGIIRVEGSQPCFKCLISQGKLKTRPDPTPPPSGRTKPSLPRKKKDKKLQGVDNKKTDEYEDDFQGSSKSSTTTEDVQTDGPKAPSEVSSSEVSSDSSSLSSEGESESENESSDDESKLPSLRPEDDDDSSTLSDDSQKEEDRSKAKKYAAKQERIKSPPTSGKKSRSSAGKLRIKSPPKERVKSPPSDRIKSPVRKSKHDPVPVRAEARSPPPAIQKVEKTSSSESSAKDDAKDSSSRASTSVSSMSDAQDTVEEVTFNVTAKKDDASKKVEDISPADDVKESSDEKPSIEEALTKPVEIPERPPTPEPESESSSSGSESETSEAESVKSKHSDGEEKTQEKEEVHGTSIIPLVKSRVNVDLSNRQLTDSQTQELVKYFRMDFDSQKVQSLNVSGCKIGDESSKRLFGAMSKLKSLRKLEIMGNELSGDSVEDILNLCQKNPVEELNVANNPLNDGGCEQLLSGFTKSQATVVTAKIQKKVSQTLIASVLKDTKKEMADEIGTSMSSASSMSSLASSAVSDAMFILKKLDISHTKANHAAFVCLGQYLSLNPKLESLNISGNTISTTALEALIKPLSDGSNKKLRSLTMNETTMDDRHARLLAEMLKGKSSLEELNIKGNRITEEGLRNVKQLKDTNDSLKQLKTD